MPVICKLRRGKWRILEPGGTLAKKNGTAVDGGGHTSKAACSRQAAAINANMKHTRTRAVLSRKETSDFTFASSERVGEDGLRRKSFKKDMICVGRYVHPFFEWEMNVTPERMQKWVDTFKDMRENGIDIPITQNHSRSAEDCQGYVIDMFIEDVIKDGKPVPTLFGIHEFRGDEAIELAGIVKNVSIDVDPDYIDGKDRHYGEAILHSSLEQDPIVPDQDEFIPMAASRGNGQDSVPRFVLSYRDTLAKESNMKTTEEMLAKITELLKLQEGEVTEDNAIELLLSRMTEEAEKAAADAEKATELTGKVEQLTQEIAASRSKGTRNTPKIDPDITDQQAELAEDKMEMLVEKGKVTPAVAASLSRILIGESGKRRSYCLSRRMSDTDDSIARGVINALEEMDLVKLGEQTGHQVLSLSRETPGGDDKAVDEETQAEMIGVGSAQSGGSV